MEDHSSKYLYLEFKFPKEYSEIIEETEEHTIMSTWFTYEDALALKAKFDALLGLL